MHGAVSSKLWTSERYRGFEVCYERTGLHECSKMHTFSWFLVLLGLGIALQYYTTTSSLSWIGARRKNLEHKHVQSVGSVFVPTRQYLVFSSVGAQSNTAIESWASAKNRTFDIVLYFYESEAPYSCFDFCLVRRDFKWPNFQHFIESNRLKEDSYSAALVIDDDFLFNGSDINTFFNIFDRFDLLFAQPSLKGQSLMHFGRHQAQRPGEFFRYVNFVENSITALRFRKAVMLQSLFREGGSGYGVDFCMLTKSNISVTDVALVHDVAAVHPVQKRVSRASVDYSSEFHSPTDFRQFRSKHRVKSKNQIKGEKLGTSFGCMFYEPKFGVRIGKGYSLKQALSKAGVHEELRSLRPRWLCHESQKAPCYHHYEVCNTQGLPYYKRIK